MADLVYTADRLEDTLKLHLDVEGNTLSFYSNNVTPSKDSVYADFEITANGITETPITITLDPVDWAYSPVSEGVLAEHEQQVINVTGPLTIYGYFLADDENVLIYAQRFNSPPISVPSGRRN